MKLAFIIAIIACSLAVTTLATCTWTSPDGNSYDFTGSKDKTVIIPSDHLTYSFSFCGETPENKECAAKGNSPTGCAYEDDHFWIVTSRWDKTEANGPASIVEKPEGGLTVTFTNGDAFPSGAQSKLIIDMACSKESKGSYVESLVPVIRLSIESPLACTGGGGLSGGGLFLILFFSFFAGYFIIGFIVCKFVLKKEGVVNAIPQNAFWCALPGLYVAGIKCLIGKVTGGGSNKSADYSSSSEYGATEDV